MLHTYYIYAGKQVLRYRPLRTSGVVITCLVMAVLPFTLAEDTGPDQGIFSPPAYGRNAEDLAIEEFLLKADIVRIERIGEGITNPYLAELQSGDRKMRAIFKTVDIDSRDPQYTSAFEFHFTDKYVYEVAAYRLDRFLGIGLTPPTVTRKVEGEDGALQLWIENAIKMQDAIDRNLETGDVDLFLRRKVMMNILDCLIHNIDRNPSNILVQPKTDGFWLIDHSRAFRESAKIPFYISDWSIPAPEEVKERLRVLDREALDTMFGELLNPKQIKAILKRRDRVLKLVK